MITVVKPSFVILTDLEGIEQHIERCGRVCYKSEDRITPDSAEKFIRMICKNGHESVLEHSSITAVVVLSRAASHQLVRHRIAAYSQESQRYCNYGKRGLQVICPPSIGLDSGEYVSLQRPITDPPQMELLWFKDSQQVNNAQQSSWLDVVNFCYHEYLTELQEGIKPEDARFVLPNATKTEIAVTFNCRMWRHVFKIRALNSHAQWEIRSIFSGILEQFKEIMPAIFGDLG